MSRSRLAIILFAATLHVLPLIAAGQQPPTSKDMWSGVYLNGGKIGYSRIKIDPSPTGYTITSSTNIRLEILGNTVSQESNSTTLTDKAFNLKRQTVAITSNGSTLRITADFKPTVVDCVIDSGGGPTKKQLKVPAGARLVADTSTVTLGQTIQPGQSTKLYVLEPATIRLEPVEITVLSLDKVKVGGQTVSAKRIKAAMSLANVTAWEGDSGETLKTEMSLAGMEMTMYAMPEPEAKAKSTPAPSFEVVESTAGTTVASTGGYKPPPDFALATAITIEKPIESPRAARSLTATFEKGKDAELPFPSSDSRQKVIRGNLGDTVTVTMQSFDESRSVMLPITDQKLRPFLSSAPYLEIDDPGIRSTAQSVKGQERNAYRVVKNLSEWVTKRMKPDYTIGVPRSCAEVLKRNRGVCRDYATLLAGLARAAGVPTRVVGGIVFAEGKFFYHAWVESWVGDWIAFDPTQNGAPVDATHIKFTQGDVTDMYGFAAHVGKIKIKNLSVLK